MALKISFTGDLMVLLPELRASYDGDRYNFSHVFSKIEKLLKQSDYVVGNLETPLASKELGYTNEPTVFNTPEEFVIDAKNAGFKCISLANNHCLDRGIPGLMHTLSTIKSIGIDYVGAYDDKCASEKPLIKQFGKNKISFLSYTYGTNSEWRNNKLDSRENFRVDLIREQDEFNNIKVNKNAQRVKQLIKSMLPQKIRELIHPIVISDCVRNDTELDKSSIFYKRLRDKINLAKSNADMVIMLLHAGGQYNSVVGEYTRNVCRELIELGCDTVIVNHPHCVLPFEYIDGKLVLYSLGNFCFTPKYGYYYKGVYAVYSLIFNLYIEDDLSTKKSISICKVVKEKSGHSVVCPLYELIKKSRGWKKRLLIRDNQEVLKRFFGDMQYTINLKAKEEYFF